MVKVVINKDKCKGCLLCVDVCPKKILMVKHELNKLGYNPVEIISSAECLGCGMCALMCPDCCIEIYKE